MWSGNIKERILYEDKDILVCQKPAGLAVQSAGIGSMDLESLLKNHLFSTAQHNSIPYLAVIHRLDQPVEGILVFAKNPKAASELNRQMADRKMEKHYLAVTLQKPSAPKAVLEDYLKKEGRTNSSRVVSKDTPGAKAARLAYQVLETKENTLIRIRLETGRHHQIRVQMAHAGMPLLNDQKYGPVQNPSQIKTPRPGQRPLYPALCSAELTFFHPSTKKKLHFSIAPENPAFDEFECLSTK